MREITEEEKGQWRKESLERVSLNRLKTIENAKNAVIKVRDKHSDNLYTELRMNDTDMLLYSIANSLLAIAQGMK